jgi:hypothetical protein
MLRPSHADDARQPLRAAGGGDDAKAKLRLAELRGLGGDPQIARERELAAATEGISVDSRNGRPRKSLHAGAQ